ADGAEAEDGDHGGDQADRPGYRDQRGEDGGSSGDHPVDDQHLRAGPQPVGQRAPGKASRRAGNLSNRQETSRQHEVEADLGHQVGDQETGEAELDGRIGEGAEGKPAKNLMVPDQLQAGQRRDEQPRGGNAVSIPAAADPEQRGADGQRQDGTGDQPGLPVPQQRDRRQQQAGNDATYRHAALLD